MKLNNLSAYAWAHARIYCVLIALQSPYDQPHKPYDQTHGAYGEARALQAPIIPRNHITLNYFITVLVTSLQLLYGMVYGLDKL